MSIFAYDGEKRKVREGKGEGRGREGGRGRGKGAADSVTGLQVPE